MAFLDYIKEATSWIFETILSGTLDICTNMVQWCASASVSFWDASLVNTLLQAGAGVSILVWAVSLIIVIQDVLEAISEEKRVYLGSVIGDSLKAIVFSQASPFLGILVIKFLFQIMALLNWSDSLVANWQSMIAVATGFSGILGIIITVIASVYFFYASIKNSGLFFIMLLLCPLYVPAITRGDHSAMGGWIRQALAILLTYFFNHLIYYIGLFLFVQGDLFSAVIPWAALFTIPRLLDKFGFSSGSGGVGQTLGIAVQGVSLFMH